jgi:diguanylate cyclase
MNELIGKGRHFVRRVYWLRIVGLGIGFFCVASVFTQVHAGPVLWALLVFHGFAWPHLAYRIALASDVPYRGERVNLMIDSAFGGLWLVAMRFNVLPCVLILVMLGMDNLAAGGMRLFVRGLAAHIVGALAGGLALGFAFAPQSQMPTILACLPFLIVYPLSLGWATYLISQKLALRSKELERLSQIDGLTGLWNRRYWESLLAREFERCRVTGATSCLLLVDLDYFKLVNDTRGHPAGDAALQHFADLLRENLPPDAQIGRYGGEEFGVMLTGIAQPQARAIVETLLQHIRSLARHNDTRCPCTASAGLAQYDPAMTSHHVWLQVADRCLYVAKTRGRDRLVAMGDDERASAARRSDPRPLAPESAR